VFGRCIFFGAAHALLDMIRTPSVELQRGLPWRHETQAYCVWDAFPQPLHVPYTAGDFDRGHSICKAEFSSRVWTAGWVVAEISPRLSLHFATCALPFEKATTGQRGQHCCCRIWPWDDMSCVPLTRCPVEIIRRLPKEAGMGKTGP
jgi:hypothetical protein